MATQGYHGAKAASFPVISENVSSHDLLQGYYSCFTMSAHLFLSVHWGYVGLYDYLFIMPVITVCGGSFWMRDMANIQLTC